MKTSALSSSASIIIGSSFGFSKKTLKFDYQNKSLKFSIRLLRLLRLRLPIRRSLDAARSILLDLSKSGSDGSFLGFPRLSTGSILTQDSKLLKKFNLI